MAPVYKEISVDKHTFSRNTLYFQHPRECNGWLYFFVGCTKYLKPLLKPDEVINDLVALKI